MSTWFITGCSTGLGRALATAVLERGWNAVVTARSVDKVQDIADAHPDTALALALDVTDSAEVTAAVEQAEARFGNVDVLVNNAGHGYRSAVEESDDAEVAALFATNFHGPVAMIKAVLPGMRARREGAIVNVSSIAGQYSAPGSGYYSATKFALEGMSDALRKEVGPLGIKVLVVEPGAFRTDFAGRSLQQSPPPSPTTRRRPACAARRTTPRTATSRATRPGPRRSSSTHSRRRTPPSGCCSAATPSP